MEATLRYVLTGTRGGHNRIRILRAIDDRPRNMNQIAEHLDLDYKTVLHHVDVLQENNVATSSGQDYGEVHLPSEQARAHWETVEEILEETTIENEEQAATLTSQ